MKWMQVLKKLAVKVSVFVLLLAASATVAEAASFDRTVVEQVNEIVSGEHLKPGDTEEEKLKKLFSYVEQEYAVYDMQEFNIYTDWEKEYACGIYREKEGSCYHFAAAYAYLIKKVTDYEVRIGVGKTSGFGTEDLQNHAWAEINMNGQWYICDPFMDKIVDNCSGKYFLMEKELGNEIYDEFNEAEYTEVVRKKQWIKEGNKKYYLKSNWEFPSGSYKIDGAYYVFDSKGMLLQPKTNSMVKVGKTAYCVSAKGKALSGSQKIKNTYYIFNAKGILLRPKKDSMVEVRKKIYYVSKKGTAIPGWHIISGKLYSVKQSGAVRKDTEYEGITFNSKGAAKNNEACKLKITVMKVVASITSNTMTKQQKLLACWNYMVSKTRFRYVSKYPNLSSKGWTSKTAYNMLTTKKGNCYSFACAFAALAKEIGYDPYVVCGRISGRRDRARDGLTRHSWVRINGRYYDPEAQFAGWRRGIYGSRGYPIRHRIQKVVLY